MKVDIFASAVIFNDFKIFLVRRSLVSDAYPGRWDIPGGSLEVTELTLEDVARRVVAEQTGLRIMPEVMIDNKRKNSQLQVVFAARLLDELMSQPVMNPELEIMDYRWATRDEANTMILTPHTRKRIKEVFDYMHYRPADQLIG